MADKRVTDLPELMQADNGDFIPIVDSSMNVTKKVAAEKVLPNSTVNNGRLEDGAVTAEKLASESVTAAKFNPASGVSLLVDRKYSTGNTNTSGANSFQTIAGASISFTAEPGQLYLITASGGTVTNGTGSGTNVVLRLANGTSSLRDVSFSAPAGTKGVCPTIRHYDSSLSGATTINLRGASASATNVQWDGAGSSFCLTVEKVLSS